MSVVCFYFCRRANTIPASAATHLPTSDCETYECVATTISIWEVRGRNYRMRSIAYFLQMDPSYTPTNGKLG